MGITKWKYRLDQEELMYAGKQIMLPGQGAIKSGENLIVRCSTILLFFLILAFSPRAQSQVKPVRRGWHAFSIQWISFNNTNPGRVNIKPIGDDEYSIEGSQTDPKTKEYVTIKGTFLNKGPVLKFNGKIVSKINFINGGQPCELTGLSIFKATGSRKYWRLQQMLNCDGETTDYIDIFF